MKVKSIHIGNVETGIILGFEDGTTQHFEMTPECYEERVSQAEAVGKAAEVILARRVLAVSSGVYRIKGLTQGKRLKLLTEKMLEVIPDSGLGVEEVAE